MAVMHIKIPCGFACDLEAQDAVSLDEAHSRVQSELMLTRAIASGGRRPSFALELGAYAGALLMVAASTLVGLTIAPLWGNAPVVLLYLPPVLAAAVYGGLRPAIVAAVTSTLAYNYFFTAPYRTFVIHSAADVVTVIVLFLVAIVTSHLAGSLRDQVRLTAAYAARNATIAGFARGLLSCSSEQDIAEVTVRELSRLFDCNAVLAKDPQNPRIIASTHAGLVLAPSDIAAAALTLNTGEPAGRGVRRAHIADWHFRAVTSDRMVIAAVGMARDDGSPPLGDDQITLFGNLLDQVALALERARLESEARETAALREQDALRSVLLASIGEDIKPRLDAITAAVRELKRGGSSDRTLVDAIGSETSKLDRYIDNLLDLSPASDQKPIGIGTVTIDLYRRTVQRDGIDIHLTPKEYAVLAELARHSGRVLTHAHLLRTVWGPAQEQQIDYLRVAVRSLRQKLEQDPARPSLVINEPAVGYRLVSP